MLSREEKETHINRNMATKEWEVETCIQTDIKNIEKKGFKPYNVEKFEDVEYRYYKLPFKAVRFSAGRELTEEQRIMASERAKKNLHRNN